MTAAWDRLADMVEASARARDGVAQQTHWAAEDGWLIGYTTGRMRGGPHDGKFVVHALKPTGPGARTGHPGQWVETYRRAFSTRKAAKARALVLFGQHSPKWAARRR